MSRFGAKIDYWSLSFPSGEDGTIAGCPPEHFTCVLVKILFDNGVPSLSSVPRDSGLFNYQCSGVLHRGAFDSSTQTVQAGLFGYTPLKQLQADDNKYNSGFYFSLSGAGCAGVDFPAVHDAIASFGAKLTRLDVAIDYYEGELGFSDVKRFYDLGYFNSGGSNPSFHTIEPKRLSYLGEEKAGGFTLYVGKRGSAKACRAYEKYAQLSDTAQEMPDSDYLDWLRLEFQLRTANVYEIPFGSVYRLDDLIAGLYPNLIDHLPIPLHIQPGYTRFDPLKLDWNSPQAQVSIEHLCFYLKQSYGGFINLLENKLNLSPEQVLEKIRPDNRDKLPKRCLLPDTFLQGLQTHVTA